MAKKNYRPQHVKTPNRPSLQCAGEDGLFRTVLIVDERPEVAQELRNILPDGYRVRHATSDSEVLDSIAVHGAPDIVLLSEEIKGRSAHDVCYQLRQEAATRDTPIFLLQGGQEEEGRHQDARGAERNAIASVSKSASADWLATLIEAYLEIQHSASCARGGGRPRRQKALPCIETLQRETESVHLIQDAALLALASLAETRDKETAGHILRCQAYVRAVATQLARHARYKRVLSARDIDLIEKSSMLHDIGKVGIPDHILLKPGQLTPEEFEVMKGHARIGLAALQSAQIKLGSGVDFFHFAEEIAGSHHEKWDGTGYPDGLAGEAIPLAARVMAIADVYDALTSYRVYKPAYSHEQAVAIISEGRGSHFDPFLVDIFLGIETDFRKIADEHAD